MTIVHKISSKSHCRLIEEWDKGVAVPRFCYMSRLGNTWTVSDNKTGDMWTEEFNSPEKAYAWAGRLNGEVQA